MLEKIKQTAEYLQQNVKGEMPKLAIILGTGLGSLVAGRSHVRML